jgi:hypothetical protein
MDLALTDYQACVAIECLRRERERCHGSGAEVGAMLAVELMLLQRLPEALCNEIHRRKDVAVWRVYEERLRRLDQDLPDPDPEPDRRTTPIRVSSRWTKRRR